MCHLKCNNVPSIKCPFLTIGGSYLIFILNTNNFFLKFYRQILTFLVYMFYHIFNGKKAIFIIFSLKKMILVSEEVCERMRENDPPGRTEEL